MFAFAALSFRSDSVSIIGMDISARDGATRIGRGGEERASRRPIQPSTYFILFSLQRDWDGRKDSLSNRQRNRHTRTGRNTHGRPNSTDSNRFFLFFFFFFFFHCQGKGYVSMLDFLVLGTRSSCRNWHPNGGVLVDGGCISRIG